ncbi:MAG: GNAT family N-acetyltransferase [Solirubrobacterales bacterium]|nr:GNAT family N-acetyltransferase [Solirubrobacterales bacterium]
MPDDGVPELRTPRILMRQFRQSDLDAYAAMVADPEGARFLGPLLHREQAWRGMAMHAGQWALRGYGSWAVQQRRDGSFLGRVGLWHPEGWPGIELGWILARPAWGHGYATEAAGLAMRWAWSTLGLPRLISLIDPDNLASVAVARRIGMSPAGEAEICGHRVVVYAVDAPGSDADARSANRW